LALVRAQAQGFPVDSGLQTLSKDVPVVGASNFSANLQGALTITINHSAVPVVLCIQRLLPAPSYLQLNAASCTHFLVFDANTTTASLPAVTNELHWWSLYFDASVAATAPATSVRVQLTGPVCNDSQVYSAVPPGCTVPQDTMTFAASASISRVISSAANWYVTMVVPPQIGHFGVVASDPSVQLLARLAGTPSTASADAAGSGTLSVDVPRPGTWYFSAAVAGAAQNVTLQFTADDCSGKSQQGPGCSLNITETNAAAVAPLNLVAGETAYFVVNTTRQGQLFVSAYAPSAQIQPRITATRGQLPLNGAGGDIGACNRAECSVPSVSAPNSTVASATGGFALWYVAVSATNATNNVGVWIDALCAPGCETHGTCNNKGIDGPLGACQCVSDYEGVDCSTPSGSMLGAQYIVLIIIASLVVASALIGFIAWAYMRRKRGQYDKVG